MRTNESLSGGRENKIFRITDKVIRPSGIWTPFVHHFLNFLIEEGVNYVPKPYGINENGEEILAYVQGEVYNYPLPRFMLQDHMIISSAKLLKNYHKVSSSYIEKITKNDAWMLAPSFPIEVMCHGDFAPYNTTIVDGEAYGIIDFDTVHPGPKMEDIAYAIYRWVPFSIPSNFNDHLSIDEQVKKAKLFLDTYGVKFEERKSLAQMMILRLENLVTYIKSQAEIGNQDFQKNIEEGHLKLYLSDIVYIQKNEKTILEGII